MSGAFVFAAVAEITDRVKAATSIFGYQMCTDKPDSPHLTAGQIEGEVHFVCAENDQLKESDLFNVVAKINLTLFYLTDGNIACR